MTALSQKGLIKRNETVKKILLGPFGDSKEKREAQEALYKKIVVETLLPCVTGEQSWKTHRRTKPFYEISKISDEGFVLIILENFDATWNDMAKGKLERSVWKKTNKDRIRVGEEKLDEDEKAAVPKYSDGGAGADSQGWSQEGLERFGELCRKVKKWRKDGAYQKFGKSILQEYKVHAADLAMQPVAKISSKPAFKVFSEWGDDDTSLDDDDDNDNNCGLGSMEESMDDPGEEENVAHDSAASEANHFREASLYDEATDIAGV